MKKVVNTLFIIFIITISIINPAYGAAQAVDDSEILIKENAEIGNTNGNIANGGYIVGSQSNKKEFYAYITQRFELPDKSGEPGIVKEKSLDGNIKITTGFNCRCLNNYNDEWIYYLKDNDGKIYRSKTDGSQTEKLETEFNCATIFIIDDYIIAATEGYDKGNIVATDLNGKIIKMIVNDDPRLKNLMLNIDKNYVYYYNEIDNKIYRVSYDGKKSEEIYAGAVDSFQIFENKLYVKGRESRGKKDILYVCDLSEAAPQSDTYDTKSDYARIDIDYINEFNASDLGVFFVRAPYGNALLYHADSDGLDIEWVDLRTVFDWNIYVINDKVYQYDKIGGASDKAADVGNIHYMNNKSYNAPPGSYMINDR